MMSEASPDMQELIRRALDSRVRGIQVAMPGIVVDYNAAKKTATVQPALRSTVVNDDGEFEPEDLPPIQNVKVCWPKCHGLSITGTLIQGDFVELIFQTRSPTEWRRTGQIATPIDERYHGLGYPVAFPGYEPDVTDEPDTDDSIGRPGGLRVHFTDNTVKVGTGAQKVSLEDKVNAELQKIATAFSTFIPGSGGANFPQPYTSPVLTGASNLKADP